MIAGERLLKFVVATETAGWDTHEVLQRAAKRVREWRRLHGEMSQVDFAALAHISVGSLQGFEKGTRKTRDTNLLKIATAIGVTLEDLIREDEPPVRPDPLYEDLKREDLQIAHAYHHSGADAKHAIKRFYSVHTSDERRERIAAVIVRLLAADDTEFLHLDLLISGPAALVKPCAKPRRPHHPYRPALIRRPKHGNDARLPHRRGDA
jgi:transcriptional regulator with XRE-family HTH domain